MESHSQAGQDMFVHALLGDGPGTFLDIGCGHPIELSNTYALEQLGWRGLLIDSNEYAANLCKEQRKSAVLYDDVTRVNWRAQLQNHRLWPEIDYLSLDCDHGSLEALIALPPDVRFKVLTIEHDEYLFRNELRVPMRALLTTRGYVLICSDVMDSNLSFEDWWVAAELSAVAEKFRCARKDWKQILSDAGLDLQQSARAVCWFRHGTYTESSCG